MGVVDSVRRRFSISPSPSRTSTPIRRPDSSMSHLSKQEIDEILESPYETNYTYSNSVAYMPHIGSREYIHPRLCRRFPAPPSANTRIQSTAWPFRYKNWEWYQSFNFSSFLTILQFIAIFTFTAVQFTLMQIISYLYGALRFISIKVVQYTILAPILTPYYAFKSYLYQAKFVWRTTQSIWTFLRWTWRWWTGQREELHTGGVQTRSMARGSRAPSAQRTLVVDREGSEKRRRKYLVWLFLYLPLLLMLIWAGYRVKNKMQSPDQAVEEVAQNEGAGAIIPEYELPKLRPSEQLPPHLAHPIGGPSLNIQQEIETAAHHPQPSPAEFSEIGRRFSPILHILQPLSDFTNALENFGHIVGHGIEDIFLAFFTALGEFASAIFYAIKSTAIYIVRLPPRLFSSFWNHICTPLADFVGNAFRTIWATIRWIAGAIAELPIQLWQFLSDWVFLPVGNIASRIGSYAGTRFGKSAESIARIPAASLTFLKNCLVAIGVGLAEVPPLMSTPFKWTRDNLAAFCQFCWDGLKAIGQMGVNKASQFSEWTKNAIGACISAIYQFLQSIGHGFLHTLRFIKDSIFKLFLDGISLVGWTGEKLIDGLIWVKQSIILFSFHRIGDGFFWCIQKVQDFAKFTRDNVMEKGGEFGHFILQCIWWPVQKVNTFVIWTVQHVSILFVNIFRGTANTIGAIWQSVRQFEFPYAPPETEKQPRIEPIEQILSRTPEFGEMPDNHPLVQRLRQIVLQALAEERHFVDQRIRKWVEHNVLVAKYQMQQMESKLEGVVKEKMESQHFPLPQPSEEELRRELEAKMREFLEKERSEQRDQFHNFEAQLDSKVREYVAQLSAQIRVDNSQLGKEIEELKENQQKLKKAKEIPTSEPVMKQEKLIEKDPGGKEVTRESTVILEHIQRQIEEFDESALLEKVRQLIKRELRRYDADRTGMPDYALESSGGSVLSTRCTVQYNEQSRTQKFFGIPLWYTRYSPRTVIQRKGYGASAGECWAYEGGHGYLTIGLSKRINVTAVSYEHLPVELSLDRHIRTAPKNFLVWSYQEVDDTNSRLLLGNFTYDAKGEPIQIFPVQKWDPRLTQILELETISNWGAPVTCLYRFRVHGDLMKMIPEATDDVELEALEAKHLSSAAYKPVKSAAEDRDLF